mgnify:CR=1 FL=1|jgi:hypothetical protein
MVVEMTGVSVRFEASELDGREVLILRYRLKRFVVVRFFTETYDPCTGEVCSAMDNMVGFVYRLMRFVSERPERFYGKEMVVARWA